MDSDLYDKFNVYDDQSSQENVYDDMCTTLRNYSSFKEWPSQGQLLPHQKVLAELYDTEEVYIETLRTLETYKVQLAQYMNEEDHKLVFYRIHELYCIHTSFWVELKGCFMGAIEVSQIFRKYQDRFHIYADFCSNLCHAQEKVSDLMQRSPQFKQRVRETQFKDKGQFSLHDNLSFPFSRFLRYSLLIKEMVKVTKESDPENAALKNVYQSLTDMADHCNEVKRDRENMEQISKIEKCIINFKEVFSISLTKFGRLVREGSVMCSSGDEKSKSVHLLLFETNLLICENAKGKEASLVYKKSLNLISTELDCEQKKKKKKHQFTLKCTQKSPKPTLHVITLKTADQKYCWTTLIQDTKDKLVPHNCTHANHQFQLHSFPSGTVCTVCGCILRGCIHQGYKCQKPDCDEAVHLNCIKYTQPCGTSKQTIREKRPSQEQIIKGFRIVSENPEDDGMNEFETNCNQGKIVLEKIPIMMPVSRSSRVCQNEPSQRLGANVNILQPQQQQLANQELLAEMAAKIKRKSSQNVEFATSSLANCYLDQGGNHSENFRQEQTKEPKVIGSRKFEPQSFVSNQPNEEEHQYYNDNVVFDRFEEANRHQFHLQNKVLPQMPDKHLYENKSNEDSDSRTRRWSSTMIPPVPNPKPKFEVLPESRLQQNAPVRWVSSQESLHSVIQQNEFQQHSHQMHKNLEFQKELKESLCVQPEPAMIHSPVSESSFFEQSLSPAAERYETVYEEITAPVVTDDVLGFIGKQNSQTACQLLENSASGTYLIRERNTGDFAISVKFQGSVRHLRIFVLSSGQICLASVRKFDEIKDLLAYYKRHSLKEIFANVDVCLQYPYCV